MLIPLTKIAEIFRCSTEVTLNVDSFAIDSRKVKPGGVFFALKGEKTDGHNYLEEVANKGAYAAVVKKGYEGPGYGLHLFFVEDVLEALQELARNMVKEKNLRVIAVTGSVGKTTTKDMIYHILSMKYKVHASKGNFNSQTMLPITILEAEGDEDFLLLEMGMTEKGQIRVLASIAPPEIVVLTPITYCHSQNFSSLEEIAEAKAEIFVPQTKYAVLHIHSAKYKAVYRHCFSHNILYPGKISLVLPFKEKHFNDNFIAAYEVAKYVGMNDNQIRLASLALLTKGAPHRFQKIYRDGVLFIDDSYNANILSTSAALKSMPPPKEQGRKIFVFGEMKELGTSSLVAHQIVTNAAIKEIDILLCIGKDTKQMFLRFEKEGKKACYHFDYRKLKENLYKIIKKGDVVLLKGANSHKLWKLLENNPINVE